MSEFLGDPLVSLVGSVLIQVAVMLFAVRLLARYRYEGARKDLEMYQTLVPLAEEMVSMLPEKAESIETGMHELRAAAARSRYIAEQGRPGLLTSFRVVYAIAARKEHAS